MSIANKKYDIILPNEFGRKYTKRYKQYMYSDINGYDGIPGWNIQNFGCGPSSIATILSSIGYDINPVEVAKILLLDENGNLLDFFTNKEKNRLGLVTLSYIYLLQELNNKEEYDLDYQLIKYSYTHPELKKEQITEMIKNDYMALILVGPKGRIDHPKTFSNYGHYIAVTSINNINKEFYISNPNKMGDNQIDITFSYETLISNMFSNTFDFLLIKNKKLNSNNKIYKKN